MKKEFRGMFPKKIKTPKVIFNGVDVSHDDAIRRIKKHLELNVPFELKSKGGKDLVLGWHDCLIEK